MLLTSLIPMDVSKGAPAFWARMDPSLQNLLHVPMFMLFVFLCSQSLEEVITGWKRRMGIVLAVAALVGVSMEGMQILVPGRYPSWGDMMLNLLGSILGLLLLWRAEKCRKPPRTGCESGT